MEEDPEPSEVVEEEEDDELESVVEDDNSPVVAVVPVVVVVVVEQFGGRYPESQRQVPVEVQEPWLLQVKLLLQNLQFGNP